MFETQITNPGSYSFAGVDSALRAAFPEIFAGLVSEGDIFLRMVFTRDLSSIEEEMVIQIFEDARLEAIMQYEVTFDMEVKE